MSNSKSLQFGTCSYRFFSHQLILQRGSKFLLIKGNPLVHPSGSAHVGNFLTQFTFEDYFLTLCILMGSSMYFYFLYTSLMGSSIFIEHIKNKNLKK